MTHIGFCLVVCLLTAGLIYVIAGQGTMMPNNPMKIAMANPSRMLLAQRNTIFLDEQKMENAGEADINPVNTNDEPEGQDDEQEDEQEEGRQEGASDQENNRGSDTEGKTQESGSQDLTKNPWNKPNGSDEKTPSSEFSEEEEDEPEEDKGFYILSSISGTQLDGSLGYDYREYVADHYVSSSEYFNFTLKVFGGGKIKNVKYLYPGGKEEKIYENDGYYRVRMNTQGNTMIRVYYLDEGGNRHYHTYYVRFIREEGSTPEAKYPIITSSLDDMKKNDRGQIEVKQEVINFTVSATSYDKKEVLYENTNLNAAFGLGIIVRVNGEKIDVDGGAGAYVGALRQGENVIKIRAEDSEQWSVTKIYHVYYDKPSNPDIPLGVMTVSVDAATVRYGYKSGYLLPPTTWEIYPGDTLGKVVKDCLEENGFDLYGTIDDQTGISYLSGLSYGGIMNDWAVDPVLRGKLEEDGLAWYGQPWDENYLGESTLSPGGGWVYLINDTKPVKGMSAYTANPGDWIKLRFTLGYGKDVGCAGQLGGGYGILDDYGQVWASD